MVNKVSITDENKATFMCPMCHKTKTVDVSKIAQVNGLIKIRSTCSCGHKWTSVFEKRKQYRKPVNLQGTYDHIKDGKVVDRGGMQVLDLSNGGLKLKLNAQRNLQVGDRLNLEFHLDDTNWTLVKKRVTVRSISGSTVGTTFRRTDAYGPELGFYLME